MFCSLSGKLAYFGIMNMNAHCMCRTDDADPGLRAMLSTIIQTALRLPAKIQAVCWITFWCWIGPYSFRASAMTDGLTVVHERLVAILR